MKSDKACGLLRAVEAAPPGQLSLSEIVFLPPAVRGFLIWLVRQGEVGPAEIQGFTGMPPACCRELTQLLAERGVLEPVGGAAQARYRVRLRARPARRGRVPGLDLP